MGNKTATTAEILDLMGSEDYAIILTKTGTLKGIWIPSKYSGHDIPSEINELCILNFGIDMNDTTITDDVEVMLDDNEIPTKH